jgi:hypothetical protein
MGKKEEKGMELGGWDVTRIGYFRIPLLLE